jgi:hypothetical protein
MNRSATRLSCLLLLLPALAWASVGKVALLEGKATRTPSGGAAAALAVGTELEVGDVLEVSKGNLKLQLNDDSVIMLGDASKLTIDEASFGGQERSFVATLGLGKLWTKVTKAVGKGKFEVKTDKAVAGVRGTIFRIDAKTLLAAAGSKPKKVTVVAVTQGVVEVKAKVKKAPVAQAPAGGRDGGRKQIAPPFKEVSKDEWEDRFVALQANMKVTVGEDLWQEASVEATDKPDLFDAFVGKNQ